MSHPSERTFRIGHHIWFVLHYDQDGRIEALEEHDWREGGYLPGPRTTDWAEYFIKAVQNRMFNDPNGTAEKEARAFLESAEKERMIFGE